MHEQKHVFARLRLRITLTCTVLTGAVLLAACLVAFRAAVGETRRAAEQTFLAQCQTVEDLLSAGTGTDTQALLRFAQQNRLIIAVNDGGTRLSFAPESTQQTLSALVDACALKEPFSAVPEFPAASYDSRLQAAEESYRVHMSGRYRSAVLWHNTLIFQKEEVSNLSRLRRTYGLIFLGGLLLLAAIAWIMSRQMIRPAQAAQQEQLRFFAMASHELKSPLAVIASSVEMLQRGLGSLAEQSHCIQQEVDQLARLVDDMLVLSGSGTGRWTLRRGPIQPEDIVLSAYEAYVGLMEKKGQTLCLRLPEETLPVIDADEQRLRQILIILLDNAYHHTPANREILLCAMKTSHEVIFQVMDHGDGIPNGDKKRIFHCFYQKLNDPVPLGMPNKNGKHAFPRFPLISQKGDNTFTDSTAQNPGHFGLGLAVANELAKLQGATLTVSDTAGGGTTFALSLLQSKRSA